MFDTLQDRLGGIFDKLTGRGALSEADVDTATVSYTHLTLPTILRV